MDASVLRPLFVLQPLAKVCLCPYGLDRQGIPCTRKLFQQPTTILVSKSLFLALGVDCSHELKKTALLIAGFSLIKACRPQSGNVTLQVCSWLYTIYKSNLTDMHFFEFAIFQCSRARISICAHLV